MLFKKGQVSIELLIVMLFLIAFIYVYNTLAEQTVYSLELTKIKEQEQDIALSLNEFLQLQRNVFYDSNITYQSEYTIPEIALASKKIPCKINLADANIVVDVNSDWQVNYVHHTNLSTTVFEFPTTQIMCGQQILCDINSETLKIKCS